jgi:hypothetical protein
MAAPVSTESARERLEKSTGDFDRTDVSTDDGRAAEVAEGLVLMVDGGWCLVFALGGCYDGGKGRCRLDAMVSIIHRAQLYHDFNLARSNQRKRPSSGHFTMSPPCPDEAGIAMHHMLGPAEWRQGCKSEVAIELKSWAGGLIRDRHQDRRELQTVLYP